MYFFLDCGCGQKPVIIPCGDYSVNLVLGYLAGILACVIVMIFIL
jgi:hypothetical protein